MPTLTPQHRNEEASGEAMQEGLVSGGFVLAPSLAALYIAMQNQTFRMHTNWQSRTAMVVMPALFAFAITSEHFLQYKMHDIARETQHNEDTVKWAEQHRRDSLKHRKHQEFSHADHDLHISNLYKQSVEESGVNIVPGDTLGLHHRAANFVSKHPFKVLLGLAAPAVALIFYGRTGKQHLQPSMRILHTRVFGQFTTVSLLLSIMGFKDYMDRNGRFITEVEAEHRVQEMHRIRQGLMDRLEYEQEKKEKEARELAAARKQVVLEKAAKKNHKLASSVNFTTEAAAPSTSS